MVKEPAREGCMLKMQILRPHSRLSSDSLGWGLQICIFDKTSLLSHAVDYASVCHGSLDLMTAPFGPYHSLYFMPHSSGLLPTSSQEIVVCWMASGLEWIKEWKCSWKSFSSFQPTNVCYWTRINDYYLL